MSLACEECGEPATHRYRIRDLIDGRIYERGFVCDIHAEMLRIWANGR